jgi:hypothetical protein
VYGVEVCQEASSTGIGISIKDLIPLKLAFHLDMESGMVHIVGTHKLC